MVFVNCNKVVSKEMARFPLTIKSTAVLEEVIGMIDQCHICVGNPDANLSQWHWLGKENLPMLKVAKWLTFKPHS